MHGASSDVQNGKLFELSGVQLKAVSLFVRIRGLAAAILGYSIRAYDGLYFKAQKTTPDQDIAPSSN